jgi:hypothetical protein
MYIYACFTHATYELFQSLLFTYFFLLLCVVFLLLTNLAFYA